MTEPPEIIGPLTEIQQEVHDYFQRGGSYWYALLAVLVVIGILLTSCLLTRRQRKMRERIQPADPIQLFHNLLGKLTLTSQQRQFLGTVARDLHLVSPANVLLCPAVFDQRVEEWQSLQQSRTTRSGSKVSTSEVTSQVRGRLFPEK